MLQVTIWSVDGSDAPRVCVESAAGTRVKSLAAAGDVAVTALYDSSLWVWDLREGKSGQPRALQKRGQMEHRTSGINAVYLSPDASHALTVPLCILFAKALPARSRAAIAALFWAPERRMRAPAMSVALSVRSTQCQVCRLGQCSCHDSPGRCFPGGQR